jgi:hypothetical protein
MLNPALVVIAVGVDAAGKDWGDSIGGVDVGDTGGEDWQAVMMAVIISAIIRVELLIANSLLVIGCSLITGIDLIVVTIAFHIKLTIP